jgi:hypothetical protein
MDPEDLDQLDLEDQATEVGLLTPREYARLRHFTPQNIYHHIRNKHIEVELCRCGRKVIDVKKADEFFGL